MKTDVTRQRAPTTSTLKRCEIRLPMELLTLLRIAAKRQRVDVSDVVYDLLERHRAEIEAAAQSPMRTG